MAAADTPASIELDRTSHLSVIWPDGVGAKWNIDDLRLACPCAGCRSRRDEGLRAIPDDGKPIEAVGAGYVGTYALSIDWKDGRCNSIYSFEMLRAWADH